jgi:hypothetical protein
VKSLREYCDDDSTNARELENFDLFADEFPRVSDCRVGGSVFPRRHVPDARQARGVRTGGPQRDMQVQTGLPHRHRVQAYQRQEQFLRPR